jgi:hypothetical protein
MNELEPNLLNGETIVLQTTKHWISPARDSIVPVLLIIGGLFVDGIAPTGDGIAGAVGRILSLLGTGALLVGLGWIAYNIGAFLSAHFGVTNMRVLRYEGIFRRRTSETLLSNVTDVKYKEPFIGRMLHYGDLEVLTSSGGVGADEFKTIRNAGDLRRAIQETKMSGKPAPVAAVPTNGTSAAPAQPTAAATDDPTAALNRLAELHTQGLITDAEYETKRTEVLARI